MSSGRFPSGFLPSNTGLCPGSPRKGISAHGIIMRQQHDADGKAVQWIQGSESGKSHRKFALHPWQKHHSGLAPPRKSLQHALSWKYVNIKRDTSKTGNLRSASASHYTTLHSAPCSSARLELLGLKFSMSGFWHRLEPFCCASSMQLSYF